jgi:tetratricopeptide (TPR) repeat protein
MSDAIHCPSCGHVNPAGSDSCSSCNFPLIAPGAPVAASKPAPARPEDEAPVRIERPLPHRPRRRTATDPQSMAIWLIFGALAAASVIWFAFDKTLKNHQQAAVPGANEDLQKHANELMAAIAQDSTNVDARVAFADLLFDTGNWADAIVQYRSAIRQDSSRATAIVDLGVCYFNSSQPAEARRLFELALTRDPNNAQAYFNLGILAENQGQLEEALRNYHSAVRLNPPQQMMEPIATAVSRVSQKLGRTPPPLPGQPGAGMPGGMPGGTPPQTTTPGGR